MNKWDYYLIRKINGIFRRRVLRKDITKYAGRAIINSEEGNALIGQMLKTDNPFAVSRFGSTELSVILRREAYKNHRNYVDNDENLCLLSGFFPYDKKLIDRFSELMLNLVGDVDLIGVWFSSLEEYVVNEYMPQAKLTYLGTIEPYCSESPWSEYLAGKKVLVVHPFSISIMNQYQKRKLLFADKRVLPEFELKTYKAVQTIAGEKDERFQNWFEALEHMRKEIAEIDFDVAIIGCGAYGMPLAVDIKKMGKQAIHMGGATQILFGIKGARWDANSRISSMYNEHWVRPEESERCKNSQVVEGGCYW